MDRIPFLLTLSLISQESLPGLFLAPGAWAQPERGMWVGQPEGVLGDTPRTSLYPSSPWALLKASSIPTPLRSPACSQVLLSPSRLFPVPLGEASRCPCGPSHAHGAPAAPPLKEGTGKSSSALERTLAS